MPNIVRMLKACVIVFLTERNALIRSYVSTLYLKKDVSKSHFLKQVKNVKHRRAVAKLQSGNHSLKIESGLHCKLPDCLKICQRCRSNQTENENHFLFHCDRYKTNRQQIKSDIVLNIRHLIF